LLFNDIFDNDSNVSSSKKLESSDPSSITSTSSLLISSCIAHLVRVSVDQSGVEEGSRRRRLLRGFGLKQEGVTDPLALVV
jgi:hypothetical protein